MAKILKGQFSQTSVGTPFYSAPEVWKKKPQYLAVDVWSLGCILHEMLTHELPFTAQNLDELS